MDWSRQHDGGEPALAGKWQTNVEESPADTGARPASLAVPPRPASLAAPASRPDPDALLAALRAAEDERAGPWHRTWQWIVAALVTMALAWITYSHDGWVPILSYFDLGVHEFGHLLTAWAPPLLCSLAGSVLQVAAPLGLAAYFWRRRDHFAVILMVAWAAESLNNVSVYIADARRMALTLFGDDGSGAGHDWHNILGELGRLEQTDQLAALARAGSVVLFVAALGLAVLGYVRAHRAEAPVAPRDVRLG